MTSSSEAAAVRSFEAYLTRSAVRVDAALDKLLPSPRGKTKVIHEAMRYTTLAEGKRLRPALVLLAYETAGGRGGKAVPVAAALEMVHAFSLIHDDLPAMDDDDFRRGQPSNHKVYGEGVAVLAGDALLTLAFHILAGQRRRSRLGPEITARLVEELSVATGSEGVIGGQVMDLLSEGKKISRGDLDYIHRHKTARLFTAALRLGAMAADAPAALLARLTRFGEAVGLAFQVVDDVLGAAGTFRELGRDPGRDEARGKATFPKLLGFGASHRAIDRLLAGAKKEAALMPAKRNHYLAFLQMIDRRRRDASGAPLGTTEAT